MILREKGKKRCCLQNNQTREGRAFRSLTSEEKTYEGVDLIDQAIKNDSEKFIPSDMQKNFLMSLTSRISSSHCVSLQISQERLTVLHEIAFTDEARKTYLRNFIKVETSRCIC